MRTFIVNYISWDDHCGNELINLEGAEDLSLEECKKLIIDSMDYEVECEDGSYIDNSFYTYEHSTIYEFTNRVKTIKA